NGSTGQPPSDSSVDSVEKGLATDEFSGPPPPVSILDVVIPMPPLSPMQADETVDERAFATLKNLVVTNPDVSVVSTDQPMAIDLNRAAEQQLRGELNAEAIIAMNLPLPPGAVPPRKASAGAVAARSQAAARVLPAIAIPAHKSTRPSLSVQPPRLHRGSRAVPTSRGVPSMSHLSIYSTVEFNKYSSALTGPRPTHAPSLGSVGLLVIVARFDFMSSDDSAGLTPKASQSAHADLVHDANRLSSTETIVSISPGGVQSEQQDYDYYYNSMEWPQARQASDGSAPQSESILDPPHVLVHDPPSPLVSSAAQDVAFPASSAVSKTATKPSGRILPGSDDELTETEEGSAWYSDDSSISCSRLHANMNQSVTDATFTAIGVHGVASAQHSSKPTSPASASDDLSVWTIADAVDTHGIPDFRLKQQSAL
ncbi:hypothetical protein BC831DRAFT_516184, partial [Entophlyctis helioformis]